MQSALLQNQLFQLIKTQLPQHVSLAEAVAELLEISNDSAYRRMRGEKQLTLEEIQKLVTHFKISIDSVLNASSNSGSFSTRYVTQESFDFGEYLKQMSKDLKMINSLSNRKLIFFSKDIPPFHYFTYPELAAFKYFFWMKTVLQFNKFNSQLFSFDILMEPLVENGLEIVNTYNQIPCAEIMNVENINTTLRQIEFYKDTYQFKNKEDVDVLYKKLHEMTDHIYNQAEAGQKFFPTQSPEHLASGSYELYVNDFVIGDNSSLITTDNGNISFIIHSLINYCIIKDAAFVNYQQSFIQNVIKKSILISKVDEKHRRRFFYLIHDKIDKYNEGRIQSNV